MVTLKQITEYFNATNMSKNRLAHIQNAYTLLNSLEGNITSTQIIENVHKHTLSKDDIFFGITCLRLHGFLTMNIVEKNHEPPTVHIQYKLNKKKAELK